MGALPVLAALPVLVTLALLPVALVPRSRRSDGGRELGGGGAILYSDMVRGWRKLLPSPRQKSRWVRSATPDAHAHSRTHKNTQRARAGEEGKEDEVDEGM